mgnify:CR=1 FL=1
MAQSGMKELNKIVNAFTVYKFIQSIITPFNAMPAYKLGIIDAKGNFLKKQEDLKTDAEKKASTHCNISGKGRTRRTWSGNIQHRRIRRSGS